MPDIQEAKYFEWKGKRRKAEEKGKIVKKKGKRRKEEERKRRAQ